MTDVTNVTGDLLRVDDRMALGPPYGHSIRGNLVEFLFRVPSPRAGEPWTHFELHLGSSSIIREITRYPGAPRSGDTLSIVQLVEITFP